MNDSILSIFGGEDLPQRFDLSESLTNFDWSLFEILYENDSDKLTEMCEILGLDPVVDLIGRNFSGMDLSSIDLSGVNLSRCDLTDTSISMKNFGPNTILVDAKLDFEYNFDELRPMASWDYSDFDFHFEEDIACLWSTINPIQLAGRPIFDSAILDFLSSIYNDFSKETFGRRTPTWICNYSKFPGIFSLGEDLDIITKSVRNNDKIFLEKYLSNLFRVYRKYLNYDNDIVSVALVEGDALGSGFEFAVCHDVLFAERSARMGFPQIIFDLLPPIGYQVLAKKIGPLRAKRLVAEGRIYSAEELTEWGIVDVLVDDGTGREAVTEHIRRNQSSGTALPLSRLSRWQENEIENLFSVVGHSWIEQTMKVSESAVRKMERLADAQTRRIARMTDRERP